MVLWDQTGGSSGADHCQVMAAKGDSWWQKKGKYHTHPQGGVRGVTPAGPGAWEGRGAVRQAQEAQGVIRNSVALARASCA